MPPSRSVKPPKYAKIKFIALGFPGAHEVVWRGWPWFNVGKKTFALFSENDRSWIFKLPHHQQMMLFDARPETFKPMTAGRMIWSYVRVEDLDLAELRDLLEAAWRMVAPKKLQRSLNAEMPAPFRHATYAARHTQGGKG
jgi:hypothetical protein